MKSLSVQIILCAGDIVDGNGDANVCCDLLQQNRVVAVRGNHDAWLLSRQNSTTRLSDLSSFSQTFIANLPATQEIETTQGRLLLCHGIGNHDMAKVTADDYGYALESNFELQEVVFSNRYAFMVNGHTHRRMVRKFKQLAIINGGSLITAQEPVISVLDLQQQHIKFLKIATDRTIEPIETYALDQLKSEPLQKSF